MGAYLNPGNQGFREILQLEYVDKTGLIDLVNRTVGTVRKLSCVSRPRRFGKSFAAKMLCAYYDCSCDSRELFEGKEIAGTARYEEHLNQYHVIHLDISGFLSDMARRDMALEDVPNLIADAILAELGQLYPECLSEGSLMESLIRLVDRTGRKVVFVIDEWDDLIWKAKYNTEPQEKYLNLLRGWFKNSNFTPQVVAAAYMTGILPIKMDSALSAISDFEEYTIVQPGEFADYVGFTESEVKDLCAKWGCDFSVMKQWYDGYAFDGQSIYNPNSVMKAIYNRDFTSYWTETSAVESLVEYISRYVDSMAKTVAELIDGIAVPVDPFGFVKGLVSCYDQNDVLTLLVHLGYLVYERETGTARIPNEEIHLVFARSVRRMKKKEKILFGDDSDLDVW